MTSKRIVELDVLKAMAIAAIVICHLRNAIPQLAQSTIAPAVEIMVGDAALGLFFFLSGYTLMLKGKGSRKEIGAGAFIKRRAVRIFPLYWTALVMSIVVQSLFFQDIGSYCQVRIEDVSQLLICAAGLQALFKNVFVDQNIGIFWFVGTILLYYLMFPVILAASKRMRGSFTSSVLSVSLVLYLVLALVALLTRTFDERIFYFYWFFIAGIIVGGRMNVLEVPSSVLWKLGSLSFVGLVSFRAFSALRLDDLELSSNPALGTIERFYITALLGVVGIAFSLLLVRFIGSHATGWLDRGAQRMGRCSYSIYLFHLMVLEAIAYVTLAIEPMLVPLTVVALGIPLALLLPPCVEEVLQHVLSRAEGKDRAVRTTIRR